jgi:hypothetical protein
LKLMQQFHKLQQNYNAFQYPTVFVHKNNSNNRKFLFVIFRIEGKTEQQKRML